MEYFVSYPWALGFVLAIVLALVFDFGQRVAVRFKIAQVPERKNQLERIGDGLFLLVSLLLGFTLTLAASRYSDRRSLLVEEAISIGTTYLRASTLPSVYREHSRELLREYVDSRLELNDAVGDEALLNKALQHSKDLQEKLWSDAAAVAQTDRTAITGTYINSLNETIDLHDKRVAAFENLTPISIWILIFSVSMIAVFTRGLTHTSRFWLSLILVPITVAIVVALIADLDSSKRGLMRLDQQAIQRLKTDMHSEQAK